MFKIARVLAATGCLLFAQGALAELPFKAGDREITFAGSLTQASAEAEAGGLKIIDEDVIQFIVTGTYGYFLNERMMVGLTTGVRWVDSDSSGSTSDALGGVSFDYHFPREGSAIVPVVGVLARTVLFDGLSDYTYGINGGVRVLASTDISVNIRAYYEHFEQDFSFGGLDGTATEDDIGVRAGFTWLLR